jgi:hypothetical protein
MREGAPPPFRGRPIGPSRCNSSEIAGPASFDIIVIHDAGHATN